MYQCYFPCTKLLKLQNIKIIRVLNFRPVGEKIFLAPTPVISIPNQCLLPTSSLACARIPAICTVGMCFENATRFDVIKEQKMFRMHVDLVLSTDIQAQVNCASYANTGQFAIAELVL